MSQAAVGGKERESSAQSSVRQCVSPDDEPLTSRMNGTPVRPMGSSHFSFPDSGMVITTEMCFFCFDVLHCHLNQGASLRPPAFSNESL